MKKTLLIIAGSALLTSVAIKAAPAVAEPIPADEDPARRSNGAGDAIVPLSPRVILRAAYAGLRWPRPFFYAFPAAVAWIWLEAALPGRARALWTPADWPVDLAIGAAAGLAGGAWAGPVTAPWVVDGANDTACAAAAAMGGWYATGDTFQDRVEVRDIR